MGDLIPLTDASRWPVRMPLATALIIRVNVLVFLLALSASRRLRHGLVSHRKRAGMKLFQKSLSK
jgi:hypothetical protein